MFTESERHTSKTEEYIGSLRIGKDQKYVGKALLLIEYVNDFPVEARIYLVGRQSPSKSIDFADSDFFYLKTPGILISLNFSGKRHWTIPLFSSSSQAWMSGIINHLDIRTVTMIPQKSAKNENNLGTQIIAQLSPISFLKHNLGWFLFKATKNLDQLSSVRNEFEFEFTSVGYNCKLIPFLLGGTDMENNIVNLKGVHVLTFDVPESPSNDFALNLIKPNIELLLRVLSFLDNRRHIVSRLKSETTTEGIEHSYEEWNRPQESMRLSAISGVRAQEYLSTADRIYYVISTMSDPLRHKVYVAFERFLAASEQRDLSISIALYHVVFCLLLSILEKRQTDLSSKKRLARILRDHGIKHESEDIEAVEQFNQIRNTVFKKPEPSFNYSANVLKNMNLVLLIVGRLFSRVFQLDELGEKAVRSLVQHYHCLNVVEK